MDQDKVQAEIIRDLVHILNYYDSGKVLFSNQGQALDGYSALANFLAIARKAKKLHIEIERAKK